jgi:hypothetical protein
MLLPVWMLLLGGVALLAMALAACALVLWLTGRGEPPRREG